jgi:hypothetical protein
MFVGTTRRTGISSMKTRPWPPLPWHSMHPRDRARRMPFANAASSVGGGTAQISSRLSFSSAKALVAPYGSSLLRL